MLTLPFDLISNTIFTLNIFFLLLLYLPPFLFFFYFWLINITWWAIVAKPLSSVVGSRLDAYRCTSTHELAKTIKKKINKNKITNKLSHMDIKPSMVEACRLPFFFFLHFIKYRRHIVLVGDSSWILKFRLENIIYFLYGANWILYIRAFDILNNDILCFIFIC